METENTNTGVGHSAMREAFNLSQRQAQALMSATMIPKDYKNNIGNCLIAVEMATRLNMPALEVMQNLYVVHGMPAWKSSFLTARINASGRYSSLRYEERGDIASKDYGCRAYAIEIASGERLNGTWITWVMVQAEGWDRREGSKWKTMPEQMFKYRAAAFWQRAFAPEISMGVQTGEEAEDIAPAQMPAGTTTISFSPKQMNDCAQEIREHVTSVSVIREKYPNLSADQVAELQKIEDAL
jgi:hypothetical protein